LSGSPEECAAGGRKKERWQIKRRKEKSSKEFSEIAKKSHFKAINIGKVILNNMDRNLYLKTQLLQLE
jgi:hypothetical protein